MKLTRNEIETALKKWNLAWDNHDLDGVMDLFHEKVHYVRFFSGILLIEEGQAPDFALLWELSLDHLPFHLYF
jgi:hypothetical protein